MNKSYIRVLEEAPKSLLLLLHGQVEEKDRRRFRFDLPRFVVDGPGIEAEVSQATGHAAAASKHLDTKRTARPAELKSLPVEFPRAAGACRRRKLGKTRVLSIAG